MSQQMTHEEFVAMYPVHGDQTQIQTAVLVERERCAKIAVRRTAGDSREVQTACYDIAADIRSGK